MYDTIVIGAGQAGLAISYYLKKANKKFVIIDKCDEIGEAWKERYDSLVLFTPRMYSSLPGLPLTGDQQGLPVKDEIVKYLKKYAEKFELPIQLNEKIEHVSKVENYFLVKTNKNEYKAQNVIVATGPFQTPNIPDFSKQLPNTIHQLHSSSYKNPDQLVEGNVLVVGGGNSGAQIAVELSKVKKTYLAVSNKINYLPLNILGKSIFWWFEKLGILQASNNSLLGKLIQKKGDPIFGFELKQAIKKKEVNIKKRVVGIEKNQLLFEDGSLLQVNNIIWATGFKTEFPWLQIQGVVDNKGKVIHDRGVSTVEGLYFIGLPWQYRRGSALLQGVGYDAKYIVSNVKKN